LKHVGVTCVLAESIARIFYRNAITIGLPVLECPDGSTKVAGGDELIVDLKAGTVENTAKTLVLRVIPLPEFMMEVLEDGGLIEHLKGRNRK
jgi:3-isopropylmalate/(R)-2-methylmalate dehydratase small subunit